MQNLLHGDCLDLLKTLPDNSVDMILCDPPYGTTKNKWDSVINLELMWIQLKRVAKANSAIVLFGAEPFSSILRLSNIKNYKHDWVWKKENVTGFLNAKKYPLMCIENISVFCTTTPRYFPIKTEGKAYNQKSGKQSDNYGNQVCVETINNGDRYPLNFLEFKRDKNKFHPTQKPVALLEYLIKTYTLENETVLDFTMGSGSTGVACVNTNRKFIGIEMDDNYFEIAKNRIEGTREGLENEKK